MNVSAEYDPGVDIWVSKDSDLGVFSQGATELEALDSLRDAVMCYLYVSYANNCVSIVDKVQEILERNGYEKIT